MSLTASQSLVVHELRSAHNAQLDLLRELHRKIETLLRLGVFLATGLGAFLTFALQQGIILHPFSLPMAWLTIGATTHGYSFWCMLSGYGPVSADLNVDLGPDPEELPARPRPRQAAAVVHRIIESYRRSVAFNRRVYSRVSGEANYGAALLVLAAMAYVLGIYLLVGG